jgi:hypothetical protein
MPVGALLVALAIAIAVHRLTRGEEARGVAPDDIAVASESQPFGPLHAPEKDESSDVALKQALKRLAQPDPPVGLALTVDEPEGIGSIVWGTVVDPDAAPIAEAHVSFTDRLGERIYGSTGSEGHYSVSGLRTGNWFVEASAKGFLSAETWMQFEDRAPRVQRDFQLERIDRLIVRLVTSDGRPFFEVERENPGNRVFWITPMATKEPPTDVFQVNTGDWLHRFGAGRHEYPAPTSPPGAIAALEILEPRPVYVSLLLYQEVLATQLVSEGQSEVVFVLDLDDAARHLAELELTVLDAETGAPLADALANFQMSAGMGQVKKSDPQGRIVLKGRAPGRYDFFVRAEGHSSERLWIEIPPGAKVDRTLALPVGARIQGRVVDENGQPFAAEIELGPAPRPGELPASSSEAFHIKRRTHGDGSFDLEELAAGRWMLQFHDARNDRGLYSHMSANVVVDTTSGPVTDLVVRAIPTGVLVVTWWGLDREGVELRFLDGSGLVRTRRRFGSGGPNCISLPQGAWRMCTLDRNGAIVDERDITLGAEPVVLELGQ